MPDRKPPATDREAVEGAVRDDCYSAWSAHYYDDYYQGAGAYPPVHTDIVRGLLRAAGARTVLDAGCRPASMLRDLAEPGLERCRVLAEQGLPAERVWEGGVLDPAAFRARAGAPPEGFDAVVCFGVGADAQVLANLRAAVRPGGLVAIEARNQLVALFTFNRYSRDLFHDVLIGVSALEKKAADAGERAALERALAALDQHFRIDLPPERTGDASRPGYDEVLSRTHNPFLLRQVAEENAGSFSWAEAEMITARAFPPVLTSGVGSPCRGLL